MTDAEKIEKAALDKMKALYSYNKTTGHLILNKTGKKIKAKEKAGYIKIIISRKYYKGHKICYFLATGRWPKLLDHIDGNRANNKFNNLREVTASQNALNCKKKSKTGLYKGVCKRPNGKYRVELTHNYKRIHIGYFFCPHKAARAYNKALHKLDPLARKNKIALAAFEKDESKPKPFVSTGEFIKPEPERIFIGSKDGKLEIERGVNYTITIGKDEK